MSPGTDAITFATEAASLHLRLVRVVYALGRDRELAEECAQDALAAAWARVNTGDPLDSIEAWTVTVALNRARSVLRRRGTERRALQRVAQAVVATSSDPSDPPGGAPLGVPTRLSAEVHLAVLALPLRQREVVVRHYLLDQDIASIAADAGISAGAVKNALFHARSALARTLGGPSAAPEPPPAGRPPDTSGDRRAAGEPTDQELR